MSTPSDSRDNAVTQLPATPFYRSRTFLINVIALLSLIFPQIRNFLNNNPETFVGALGALNVLLRFITVGKYQIVDDTQNSQTPTGSVDITTTGSGNTSEPDGSGRFSSLTLLLIGAVSAGTLLATSCSSGLGVSYDPDTGAASITKDGKTVVITVNPNSGK